MPSTAIANKLAKSQKEISVSEFFEKNRQILGFDSPIKSLIMGVKEAVDNALDACEEAQILPDIVVKIDRVDQKEFRVTVEDNGPGIVPSSMPNVFGRLLYGSRFHAVRQSRGQQGIGISATIMFGQITTGKAATARSKVEGAEAAKEIDIIIDTKKNAPVILRESYTPWDEKPHGTRVEYYMNGRYVTGKQSVLEYLRQTAIVNPHATVTFIDPDGKRYVFERATEQMPPPTKEIKPHPDGIELGTLMNMIKSTKEKSLVKFLQNDFNRVSERVAKEICAAAAMPETTRPSNLSLESSKQLLEGIGKVKIMAPQVDCLSPIGESLIRKGLKHVLLDLKPEFYAPPVTREPKVHSGNPFLIEVGIVYGGDLPGDQQVQILRFANRVPLLYQQGACVVTKAIESTDWRRYGLEQRGGSGIPFGPAIILVHVASTKIPFTSEAKEAISSIPSIQEEIELALKACGRSLRTHLNKKERKGKTRAKFEIVQVIIPLIAEKTSQIVGKPVPDATRSRCPFTTTPPSSRSSSCTPCCPRARWTSAPAPSSPPRSRRTTRSPGSCPRSSPPASSTSPSTSMGWTRKRSRRPRCTSPGSTRWTSWAPIPCPGTGTCKGSISPRPRRSPRPRKRRKRSRTTTRRERNSMKSNQRNTEAVKRLYSISEDIYDQLDQGKVPKMVLPLRTKSNIKFDPKTQVWKYGGEKGARTAKKVKGAMMLLRTSYMLELIQDMIENNKSSTLREAYYISEGWGKAKFHSQDESNLLAEDLEIVTQCLREDFKLRPEESGASIIGNLDIVETDRKGKQKRLNCSDDVGDSGYGIPYNVEKEKIEIKGTGAKFVVAIETGGMFDRLVENGFDEEFDAPLVHQAPQRGDAPAGHRVHRRRPLVVPHLCLRGVRRDQDRSPVRVPCHAFGGVHRHHRLGHRELRSADRQAHRHGHQSAERGAEGPPVQHLLLEGGDRADAQTEPQGRTAGPGQVRPGLCHSDVSSGQAQRAGPDEEIIEKVRGFRAGVRPAPASSFPSPL